MNRKGTIQPNNKSAPLVSVLLPVYNGEEYLSEAIDSILTQTFSDFELIIIDDGSTDGSCLILKQYEQRDPRVRVIVRENRGLATTLNDSIDLARGEWIARMDADDIALPNRLLEQLDWLALTGADICGSWVQRFGRQDQRLVRFYQSDSAIKTYLLFYSPIAHPSVILRATLAKSLKYDVNYTSAEDYDLWVRAAEAGSLMTNLQKCLLRYRVHVDQVSSNAANYQQQEGCKIRQRYWHYFFKSRKIDGNNIDTCLKIFSQPNTTLDLKVIELTFSELLDSSDLECRQIILCQLERLYLLAAASNPGIILSWHRMITRYRYASKYTSCFKIALFRFLRISKQTRAFKAIMLIHRWRNTR